jgi:ATP-binding cassette subfamily C (CFTR/MRP) protein 1
MGGRPSKAAGLSSSRVDASIPHVDNPYDTASFLSKAFFMWCSPLIRTAFTKTREGGMEESDLYELAAGQDAISIGAAVRANWNEQMVLPKGERSMTATFWPLVSTNVKAAIVLQAMQAGSQLCGPQIMKAMLTWCGEVYVCQMAAETPSPMLQYCGPGNFMNRDGECDSCPADWYSGWVIVVLFALNTATGGFLKSHSMMNMLTAGINCKTAASTLIFDKALRMSAKGRAGTDQGTAVNLVANDAEKLMMGMFVIAMAASFPILIIVGLYQLYEEIQGAAFAGVGTMLLLFLSLGKVMGKLGMLEGMRMMYADKRVKLTNEVITGIQVRVPVLSSPRMPGPMPHIPVSL